jgi:oligopeptide transport system substrate-binding protein
MAANPKMANSLIWFYNPIKGVAEVSGGKDASLITDPKTGGVRKVDDRTVRIYGAGPSAEGDPCPYMLSLLSYQAACIAPKHVAEKDEENWANKLPQISCGPYLCTEWKSQQSMAWEINPKYNGPQKVGIQKIKQYIAAANDNPIAQWLAQAVDLMASLDSPSLAVIRSNPKLNALLHFYANFESQYVSLNTFVKPLDNPKLRMALAKSIDRVTLGANVLNGTFVAGYTMLPPSFPGYNKETEKIQAYDVAAAKKLMEEAGYKDGKDAAGKQLTLEITSGNTMHAARAVFIQDQWQKNLGIKVDIKSIEGGVWGANRGKHTMAIFIDQYEYDYVDPSNMLNLFRSDPNSAKANKTDVDKWGSIRFGWYNPAFDKLIDQAATEIDSAKRIKMYQDAEVIQCTDAGLIFITHQVIYQAWWPWIVGIPADKNGNVVYRPFDLSQYQMYVHKDVDALKAQYKGIA